jgi:hypothetical protein
MTMRRGVLLLAGLVFSVALAGKVSAQTSSPSAPSEAAESIRSATVLTIHGKITAVDEADKLVTVEVNGKRVTLRVDNPYNLQAAKVGAAVVVRYYEVVSIRKKKAGEQVPSISLKEGIVTAESGTPGTVAQQKMSVLVTVVDVDREDGTVALKGPDGSVETVKARDPRNLKHIKAGDQLVVTVSRATAVAIEKDSAG